MPDPNSEFLMTRTATSDRPLQGLTVLVVEDSRFASEALRLMCLRSGARIRRADCLAAARRHLQTYRPEVLLVDLGLPDGSGIGLIARLAGTPARPPVMLAISGNADLGPDAMAVGADGFLAKPVQSLAAFQRAILRHLPQGELAPAQAVAAKSAAGDAINPDPIALRDDLAHAAQLLQSRPDASTRAYLAGFLGGIARGAHDPALADAAAGLGALADTPETQPGAASALSRIAGLVQARLGEAGDAPLWTRTARSPRGPTLAAGPLGL